MEKLHIEIWYGYGALQMSRLIRWKLAGCLSGIVGKIQGW